MVSWLPVRAGTGKVFILVDWFHAIAVMSWRWEMTDTSKTPLSPVKQIEYPVKQLGDPDLLYAIPLTSVYIQR